MLMSFAPVCLEPCRPGPCAAATFPQLKNQTLKPLNAVKWANTPIWEECYPQLQEWHIIRSKLLIISGPCSLKIAAFDPYAPYCPDSRLLLAKLYILFFSFSAFHIVPYVELNEPLWSRVGPSALPNCELLLTNIYTVTIWLEGVDLCHINLTDLEYPFLLSIYTF